MGRRESEAKRREWADGKASAEILQRKMKNTKNRESIYNHNIINYNLCWEKDKADWLSS